MVKKKCYYYISKSILVLNSGGVFWVCELFFFFDSTFNMLRDLRYIQYINEILKTFWTNSTSLLDIWTSQFLRACFYQSVDLIKWSYSMVSPNTRSNPTVILSVGLFKEQNRTYDKVEALKTVLMEELK